MFQSDNSNQETFIRSNQEVITAIQEVTIGPILQEFTKVALNWTKWSFRKKINEINIMGNLKTSMYLGTLMKVIETRTLTKS